MSQEKLFSRHCERSEAIQNKKWIAASRYALLAMTSVESDKNSPPPRLQAK
jgi:hypothetical protein